MGALVTLAALPFGTSRAGIHRWHTSTLGYLPTFFHDHRCLFLNDGRCLFLDEGRCRFLDDGRWLNSFTPAFLDSYCWWHSFTAIISGILWRQMLLVYIPSRLTILLLLTAVFLRHSLAAFSQGAHCQHPSMAVIGGIPRRLQKR